MPKASQETPATVDALHSTIRSVKEVITIVGGITITNGILMLLCGGYSFQIKAISELDWRMVICFVLLIMNIVRFYHGNMRYLDSSYIYPEKVSGKNMLSVRGGKVALDFCIIFIESLLFAGLSFYLSRAKEFYAIFIILLFIDIVWGITTARFSPNRDVFEQQKKWNINNFIAFVFLVISAAIYCLKSDESLKVILFVIMSAIILGNTVADFIISRKFYFPSVETTPAG